MLRPLAAQLVTAPFWRDARRYQIVALATLVIFNFGWIDFGARPLNSAFALIGALVTQIVCARATGIPLDLRSPLITGLENSIAEWRFRLATSSSASMTQCTTEPGGIAVMARCRWQQMILMLRAKP